MTENILEDLRALVEQLDRGAEGADHSEWGAGQAAGYESAAERIADVVAKYEARALAGFVDRIRFALPTDKH